MKLVYFTASFPYGIGEQWKANELDVLKDHFESITIIPFSYGNNFSNPKPLHPGIKLETPLFEREGLTVKRSDISKIIFNRHALTFLHEFVTKKVYIKKSKFIKWISASLNVIRLVNHPTIINLLSQDSNDTCLYFYWGKGSSELLPFIDCSRFFKTLVRMHRYDLFEYENDNYIPYRRRLINLNIIIAPSSEAGKRHLNLLYPNSIKNIHVLRCGTIGNGFRSDVSSDNILRVVSCSLLQPVKRVHLMIECLSYIDFPILWYHIGEGLLSEELRQMTKRLNVADKFIFVGMVDSRKVLDYYTDNCFDLFVNTSSSEGVPFSIMEALSVGIPVIATDAGGTGELVDEGVGQLLEHDITAQKLAKVISSFYDKTTNQKEEIRSAAFRRYETFWNAKKITEDLIVMLKK